MKGDEDLGGALLDVRKAYRLLYGFNRRVFDMARTIDGCLDGFAFKSSEAGNSFLGKRWRPQKKKTDYWLTLPFYSTIFQWAKCTDDNRLNLTDRLFAIELFADNAWGAGDLEYDADPDTFEHSPESSKTIFELYYAKPLKERDGISVLKAWDDEMETTMIASRSDDFVGVGKEINMETLSKKADVSDAIKNFVAEAESLLKIS